jgi:hypothetical protein
MRAAIRERKERATELNTPISRPLTVTSFFSPGLISLAAATM